MTFVNRHVSIGDRSICLKIIQLTWGYRAIFEYITIKSGESTNAHAHNVPYPILLCDGYGKSVELAVESYKSNVASVDGYAPEKADELPPIDPDTIPDSEVFYRR